MLVIRLFRVGKKNQPSFKIVVTDKRRSATKGRFVEEVGFYNPLTKEKVLKQERIKYWLSVGAKPSVTLQNLLVSEKIIEGKKTPIYMKKKPSVAKDMESEQTKKDVSPETLVKENPKASTEKPAPASVEASAGKEEKPVEEDKKEKATEQEKPAEETKPIEEKPTEDVSSEASAKEEAPKTE